MSVVLTKTQRLYGEHVQPQLWRHMDYIGVLELKIRLAGERIRVLNLQDMNERDQYNITECMEAIKWCRAMIQETKDVGN